MVQVIGGNAEDPNYRRYLPVFEAVAVELAVHADASPDWIGSACGWVARFADALTRDGYRTFARLYPESVDAAPRVDRSRIAEPGPRRARRRAVRWGVALAVVAMIATIVLWTRYRLDDIDTSGSWVDHVVTADEQRAADLNPISGKWRQVQGPQYGNIPGTRYEFTLEGLASAPKINCTCQGLRAYEISSVTYDGQVLRFELQQGVFPNGRIVGQYRLNINSDRSELSGRAKGSDGTVNVTWQRI